MTDLTPYDIHRLDQAVPDAFADVDRLAADPETLDRLTQRGPAVYGAELTRDLHATCGGDAITLAGWAALATLRLVQANERLHDLNAEVGPLRAKVARLTAERQTEADALDLNAIEARIGAATPGPWEHGGGDGLVWGPRIGDPVSGSVEPEDADFIAAARTDVPALVAEVRRLREQLFAQKPVIETAEAWAEAHEDSDLVPRVRRPSAHPAVRNLYDAVEQHRLMDAALTSARDEQPAVTA